MSIRQSSSFPSAVSDPRAGENSADDRRSDTRPSDSVWSRFGSKEPHFTAHAEPAHIHLVGIGGIGMSGIAEVLSTLGFRVSGSDLRESETTRHLQSLGVNVAFGHSEDNIGRDTDVVVVSSAVDDANVEVRAARAFRVPVIQRAEMLAELMRVKCGIAVAGAHGKTTTTSLVASVLHEGGIDATVVIGGRLKSLGGTNARLGKSDYMVAEADESDGSFLLLSPTVAVVTNIDREHMNYYGTMERLDDAYVEFLNNIPFYGRAFLCVDCERVASLVPRLKKPCVTYGTSLDADLAAVDVKVDGLTTNFEVLERGVSLGRVTVAMPGEHAALNALAALAVSLEFGVKFEEAVMALSNFEGVMRRFEVKGETSGITVVDDYGHHPTEIEATLRAARRGFPARRMVAVFQPHRFSRTEDLFREFTDAFADADEVVVTDVYAAGEAPIEGVDGQRLVESIRRVHKGAVSYVAWGDDFADQVASKLQRGDLVLTLGAGDITGAGPEILDALSS